MTRLAEVSERATAGAELAFSGIFDHAWYLRHNDDVAGAGIEPFQHFVEFGWAEGRWPNRYFDPARYIQDNLDVGAAGVDPLLHYIRDGEREQRRPHPLFNPGWYRAAFGIPLDRLAFGHYIAHCSTGQFIPCPELFAVPLIAPYRDDTVGGMDAVAHYLDDVDANLQEPFPSLAVVRASCLVEDNYYLVNASDVHEANIDPASHYCHFGWQEQRKPNLYFDPTWYVQTNPEVARMGLNPLVHYILRGEALNRRPAPYFEPWWYRATYAVPSEQTALGHYLANRRSQQYSPTQLFDVGWYVARFRGELGPNRDPFAHYLQAGMTQDVDPSRGFNAAQYRQTHLGHLSQKPLQVLRPDQHNPLVHYLRAVYAPCPLKHLTAQGFYALSWRLS